MFFLCQSERWAVTHRDPLPSPAWQLNRHGRIAELREIPADVRAALNGQVWPRPLLHYVSPSLPFCSLAVNYRIHSKSNQTQDNFLLFSTIFILPSSTAQYFKNCKSSNPLIICYSFTRKSQVIRFLAFHVTGLEAVVKDFNLS